LSIANDKERHTGEGVAVPAKTKKKKVSALSEVPVWASPQKQPMASVVPGTVLVAKAAYAPKSDIEHRLQKYDILISIQHKVRYRSQIIE
jgi:hypothetical protein